MAHSQFDLLRQRRFLPYFTVQAFGAFNDNVFRQAIIGLLGAMVAAGTMDPALRGTYAQLAPAVFILPYFLFSSIAGQFAERVAREHIRATGLRPAPRQAGESDRQQQCAAQGDGPADQGGGAVGGQRGRQQEGARADHAAHDQGGGGPEAQRAVRGSH